MSRKRMINPTIWQDPEFGKISLEARLLFIGLVSNADDEGRLRGHPDYLKSVVFPYDKFTGVKVEKWRDELAINMRNIILYEVNGEEFIQLKNWKKHQNQREDRIQKSEYPAYDGQVSDIARTDDSHVQAKDKRSKEKLSKDNTPHTPQGGERFGREKYFEKFWERYPRKVGKQAAKRKWMQLVTSKDLAEAILKAVEEHKKSPQWQKDGGQFIPHPSTWLNQGRWEDETETHAGEDPIMIYKGKPIYDVEEITQLRDSGKIYSENGKWYETN